MIRRLALTCKVIAGCQTACEAAGSFQKRRSLMPVPAAIFWLKSASAALLIVFGVLFALAAFPPAAARLVLFGHADLAAGWRAVAGGRRAADPCSDRRRHQRRLGRSGLASGRIISCQKTRDGAAHPAHKPVHMVHRGQRLFRLAGVVLNAGANVVFAGCLPGAALADGKKRIGGRGLADGRRLCWRPQNDAQSHWHNKPPAAPRPPRS